MSSELQAKIKFSSSEKEIVLNVAPGVFLPTGTTTLLIQAVKQAIPKAGAFLDLGCGTGVVGLALYLDGVVKGPLYASDLSESAVRCSRENFASHGCPAEVRGGSLFEPWVGHKFDVIVDDISGVAQDVAVVSSWFQGIPCETGKDGTDLVVTILRQAPNYLAPGGRFFFPVLSLSNVDVLLQTARANFSSVERIARLDWPLPPELNRHMPLLRKLAQEGSIKLQERFGMVLCYTEVYCATNS